jgi:hypothetical protein
MKRISRKYEHRERKRREEDSGRRGPYMKRWAERPALRRAEVNQRSHHDSSAAANQKLQLYYHIAIAMDRVS